MSPSRIVLITGGGRSGKSAHAQRLAESLPGPRAYVATATPFDDELKKRVAEHRGSRSGDLWDRTIEEPLALAHAIREASSYSTVLVDCLAVWMGNLMWKAEQADEQAGKRATPPTEADVANICKDILAACRQHQGTVILVSGEVGLGIIPDNKAARLYRDLLGRCNQVVAAAADTVVLVVSGLPLTLKSSEAADVQ